MRVWAHGALPAAAALARARWASRRSASCGGCAAACDVPLRRAAAARRRADPPVRGRRRRGRVPARQQRRLRLAPRAGRLDARRRRRARGRAVVRPGRLPAGRRRRPRRAVLGFHWTKVHGAPAGGSPRADRRGLRARRRPGRAGLRLGAALTLAGLRHLRDRGAGRRVLYVEADNDAAVAALPRPRLRRASAPTCRTGADPSPGVAADHRGCVPSLTPRPCSSSVHLDGDRRPPGAPTFRIKRSPRQPRDSEARLSRRNLQREEPAARRPCPSRRGRRRRRRAPRGLRCGQRVRSCRWRRTERRRHRTRAARSPVPARAPSRPPCRPGSPASRARTPTRP